MNVQDCTGRFRRLGLAKARREGVRHTVHDDVRKLANTDSLEALDIGLGADITVTASSFGVLDHFGCNFTISEEPPPCAFAQLSLRMRSPM